MERNVLWTESYERVKKRRIEERRSFARWAGETIDKAKRCGNLKWRILKFLKNKQSQRVGPGIHDRAASALTRTAFFRREYQKGLVRGHPRVVVLLEEGVVLFLAVGGGEALGFDPLDQDSAADGTGWVGDKDGTSGDSAAGGL
jgi:hypothetical protein